ncbi:GntR family transcriptional regulator [Streptomyces sp. N35]|uniref:GntR family transcriptional regulator n=1 Tax=Streptomyces sp. N35 TaxID=2795730 RepID=UPI0018F79401
MIDSPPLPRRDDTSRCQRVASDLYRRLTQVVPHQDIPSPIAIARLYRIPLPTAQFVRRTLTTRLRPAPLAGAAEVCADSANAKWEQVAQDLQHRIRTGQLRGRLPTQEDLATEYQVSLDTLRRAIRKLATEGLLHVMRGSQGTHVSGPPHPVPTVSCPQHS